MCHRTMNFETSWLYSVIHGILEQAIFDTYFNVPEQGVL